MRFNKAPSAWLCLGLGFQLLACGADPDDVNSARASSNEIASTALPLDDWWTSTEWPQTSGGYSVLEPASTHVCILTRVSGTFYSEYVNLYVDVPSDRWILAVDNWQWDHWVEARARCFRHSEFQANGPQRYSSEEFIAKDYNCSENAQLAYFGDATTHVTGFFGGFWGGGEYVKTTWSGSATVQSAVRVKACTTDIGRLEGYAYSFFAGGNRPTPPAKYDGPEHHVSNPGATSVFMANTEQAMCHFTRITGDFRGGGEALEIVPEWDNSTNQQRWRLRARRGSGSNWVAGSARCYKRDQR